MPAIRKVLALMLAGSMGWPKSTAISRFVAMPPVSGTTIDTVGAAAAGPLETAGGLAVLPQLTRKAATTRAAETWEIFEIDIQLLSQYLSRAAEPHQAAGARL